MKTILFLITGFILFALFSTAQIFAAGIKVGQITISSPWARGSFSKAKSAAAYMNLKNEGKQIDQLIAIKSDIAQKIELHYMQSKDGVIKMDLVKRLDLPAGSIVELKPGSLHVMFFGLREPLVEGAYFPLTLEFLKAGKVKIMIKVLKPGALKNKKRNYHKN